MTLYAGRFNLYFLYASRVYAFNSVWHLHKVITRVCPQPQGEISMQCYKTNEECEQI